MTVQAVKAVFVQFYNSAILFICKFSYWLKHQARRDKQLLISTAFSSSSSPSIIKDQCVDIWLWLFCPIIPHMRNTLQEFNITDSYVYLLRVSNYCLFYRTTFSSLDYENLYKFQVFFWCVICLISCYACCYFWWSSYSTILTVLQILASWTHIYLIYIIRKNQSESHRRFSIFKYLKD